MVSLISLLQYLTCCMIPVVTSSARSVPLVTHYIIYNLHIVVPLLCVIVDIHFSSPIIAPRCIKSHLLSVHSTISFDLICINFYTNSLLFCTVCIYVTSLFTVFMFDVRLSRQGQNRQGAVLSIGRQQLRTTRPQPKDSKRPTEFGHQETFLQPTSRQRVE